MLNLSFTRPPEMPQEGAIVRAIVRAEELLRKLQEFSVRGSGSQVPK